MFAPTSHSFNQVYTLNLWSWLSPYVIDPAIQITWSTVLIFYIWDASQTGPKLTSQINSCHIFYAYSPLHILNISNSVILFPLLETICYSISYVSIRTYLLSYSCHYAKLHWFLIDSNAFNSYCLHFTSGIYQFRCY